MRARTRVSERAKLANQHRANNLTDSRVTNYTDGDPHPIGKRSISPLPHSDEPDRQHGTKTDKLARPPTDRWAGAGIPASGTSIRPGGLVDPPRSTSAETH
jgi:hypothetical protein